MASKFSPSPWSTQPSPLATLYRSNTHGGCGPTVLHTSRMNRSTLNILLPQLYNCRAKWSSETYELYRTKVGFIKIKNLLVCRSCHPCCSLLIVASGVLNPHAGISTAGISTALVLAQGGTRQLSLQSEIDMLLKFHLPHCFCVNCFPILAVLAAAS